MCGGHGWWWLRGDVSHKEIKAMAYPYLSLCNGVQPLSVAPFSLLNDVYYLLFHVEVSLHWIHP